MKGNRTCIIVDDEPKARKTLESLIRLHCPTIGEIRLCEDLPSARRAVLEVDPHLVFLDIHLPGVSGFELIEGISERTFAVVFTTAYEDYAVRAFELRAQDYLVKPIHSQRLKQAVARAEEYLDGLVRAARIKTDTISGSAIQKVALPVTTGYELMEVDQVVRFKGKGTQTEVYLTESRKHELTQNLKRIEQKVENQGFFRIHRSHLVNLRFVKRFIQEDGGFVEMEDGTLIEVSRRKVTAFKKVLGIK